ncbi:CrcB family protein [Thioalkalivibrio sp. XN8]|uniref:CrcB family protein n=1 Tax=Thioalkalivibrio sp. XN8 TaxID=2712863 RepID=UPI0013EB6F35|nr:CrcB family protein [Thioalkalivibrio sp. XN8]NGP53949.1 chromosome condensation protein CrcB [Thioalkalivibrio sp. XN8]
MLADAAAVLAGGALGGMARFWLAERIGRLRGTSPAAGILAVNVSGALVAGLAAGLATGTGAGSMAWQLAVVGFLGSYTTVSSFSLQTLALLHDGRAGRAAAETTISLLGTLGGAGLGWTLARGLAGGLA